MAGRPPASPPAHRSSKTTALANSRLAVIALALLLAGCGLLPTGSGAEAEGRFGVPQQRPDEAYPGTRRDLTGELRVAANGCANVEVDGVARMAVWPSGSALSQPVRLPDGTELAHGDELRMTAAVLRSEDLGGGPEGYWGSLTAFCGADEVLVIDAVSGVR